MSQFKKHYITSAQSDKNIEIRNYWETPRWLFNLLHEIFNFTIDAAANKDNKKLEQYWGEEDNALNQSWEGEVIFCNPPTSDGEYGTWLEHAESQFLNHGVTSAMVVPFKWETKGFRAVRESAKYLLLPPTRIKFDPPKGLEGRSPTFYSCIAVFTWESFSSDDLIKFKRKNFTVIDLTNGIIAGR